VRECFARARANIALSKYWGKADRALNLPAVPSLSLTLDDLVTETTAARDPSLAADHVDLDGTHRTGDEAKTLAAFLALVRSRAGVAEGAPETYLRVRSFNRFPTASGLASSASGYAALAAAAAAAYGLALDDAALSALARRGSASAARSVFGGWVELPAGAPGDDTTGARPLFAADHWDVAMVLALVDRGPKDIASRDGMRRTAETSPYYAAWLAAAPLLHARVRDAVTARDLAATGEAMEASTMAMHASAWAAQPAVRYARGVTLDVLDAVRALRRDGVGAWATMDAGPHVKVLCAGGDAESVAARLRPTPGVLEARIARPGAGIERP
jgi:diphosphomevalonate decarboxylase